MWHKGVYSCEGVGSGYGVGNSECGEIEEFVFGVAVGGVRATGRAAGVGGFGSARWKCYYGFTLIIFLGMESCDGSRQGSLAQIA